MGGMELRALIEALLFVVDEPISRERLYSIIPEVDGLEIEAAIDQLKSDYQRDGSGLILREIGGGIQISTRAEFDEIIRCYLNVRRKAQLSKQALETLAIIAYEQPITTPEIKEIRGIDPSGVIRTLLQRKMIRMAGRKEVIGRPFMYATTKDFLVYFGLQSLEDLPRSEEFATLIGDEDEDTNNETSETDEI